MEIDSTNTKPVAALSEVARPSPATHSAATMAAENMQQPNSETTNKRVKLTMETNHTGSDFSPSIDLADPSQESKGLADWVGKMVKDDHTEDDAAAPAPSTESEATIDDSQSTAAQQKDATNQQDSETGMEQSAGQDLVNALLAPTKEPSHEDMSGSILAVASLSEPLVATLESLDSQTEATAAAGPPVSNLTVNPELSEPAATEGPVSTTSDLTAAADGSDKSGETAPPIAAEPAVSEQTLVSQDKKDVAPVEQNQPSLDQDVQMAEKPEATAVPTLANSTAETNQIKDATAPTTAPAPTVQDPPRSSPTIARDPSSPAHPESARPAPLDVNHTVPKPPQPTSLPPLSSIAGTPSHPVSQNARPSRSTMSVSALLLNNDDDSEQEQDRGRRPAGNMFDPFGNPPSRNRSISPPPPVAPPQHSSLPGPHSHSGPGGVPQHPPATLSASSIPPPRSLAGVHRGRDGIEPPMSDHSGYGRGMPDSSQSLRHSQDFTSAPGGGIRGSSKDYPADEVMESGGVIGYGSQRHRLPSPVGARPHQEPLPGPGGQGGSVPPGSSKLPGLGSVTGGVPPPPHSHDHHNRHRPMYRPEGNHPPPHMNSGRPNSYSPNQHSSMTHSPPVNGHPHYTPNGPSHHHHPSGMVSNASLPSLSNSAMVPIVERHVPRLIVKNDPSLKMHGRPELFLGYYRYDPAVLLPAMQGKENSLLEVRIASTYLTYDNVKVKKREVWGTDVYTDDSDVVAMLIHAGYYIPPTHAQCTDEDSLQPIHQHHNFVSSPIKHICPGFDLAVTLRVVPKLIKYQGSIRHRIKSRTWNTGHDGVSFRIESIRKLGAGEALNRGRSQSKRRMKEYSQERLRVLANIHDETTESLQNERAMRTATFEFTHQGDPCFKYSPELVMDRHDGLSRKWTSWRLKKEVLILENEEERYEISLQHQAGTDARRFDQYRFAVISPRTSLSSWSKASYPLDSTDLTEVLYEDLDWQDFEWVERGVVIQPSQREKRGAATSNGHGSLMEGVEVASASKDGDVDMEDGEIHDGGKDTTRPTAPASKSDDSALGGDDSQQEGVFCVVSRLYWRPMSENGPSKRASTKPVEVTAPSYGNSAPIAPLQNGPSSKDVPDYHQSTDNAVAAGQDKSSLDASAVVNASNSVLRADATTDLNQEHAVPAAVVSKEHKEETKEQDTLAPVVAEPALTTPPQHQQQQQQSAPTTATNSSTTEQHPIQPTDVPTATPATKAPSPVVNKDVEAMEVDSSSMAVTAPTPKETAVAPVDVTASPPVQHQEAVEAVEPVPAPALSVSVQEPPKAAVVAPAVVVPEDDEREEGELEEGEIASD
ncbi:hypothetical protein BGZ95_000921 [Linnemannia exigua]|uniref:Histone deacetylation protein Rxt3 n=1 Tax=Linnemannia exigua TaxID=604196 RepID=A0AAD4D849_9FUNG|nr:hypothetical protein BGZ95_000921 [Linnemannia exigua]